MLRLKRMFCGSLLLVAGSPLLGAPFPLFSNGSTNPADHGLATGTVSASGAAAPAGSQWSELQTDGTPGGGANALAGVSMHVGGTPGAYRVADDFAVFGFAYGWNVSSVSVFAYVSGGSAAFSGLNVRVWSGEPGTMGSTVVWDSAGSGALLTASPLALYRIFNSVALPVTPPSSTRQVWQLRLSTPGLVLEPAWYWVDWQATMADSAASAFSPMVTVIGNRGQAGANAVQFKPVVGVGQWSIVVDPGKPATSADFAQELPFLVEGNAAPPPCAGDADGSGLVNFADVSAVLTNWGMNYLPGTGAGDSNGNGVVDFADVTAVLIGWGSNCG